MYSRAMVAAFGSKNGNVFEAAERTKSHFAEDAQREERKRGNDELRWSELRNRTVRLEPWGEHECREDN
jgi:hypothetical protein